MQPDVPDEAQPEVAVATYLLEGVLGEWRHSFEEDTGDVQVYRPADFDFPPSFGRDGFDLHRRGHYVAHEIATADGTRAVTGRWSVTGTVTIRVELPDRDAVALEVSLDDDGRLRRRDVASRGDDVIPGLIGSTGWQAVLETEPPGPPTVTVKGLLLFRTAGFSARLEPSNPQGINPWILLLDLVVEPPAEEHQAQVVTRVEVAFRAERGDLDAVTVLPLGVHVPVISTT
jgi:hypothetical protein